MTSEGIFFCANEHRKTHHLTTKYEVSNVCAERISADGCNGQEPALSDKLSKLMRDVTVSLPSFITCIEFFQFYPCYFPSLLFVHSSSPFFVPHNLVMTPPPSLIIHNCLSLHSSLPFAQPIIACRAKSSQQHTGSFSKYKSKGAQHVCSI